MAAGTVKNVIDDIMLELIRLGQPTNRGNLYRLAREAEINFSRKTGCLFTEGSINTVSGTYDYNIKADTVNGVTDILYVASTTGFVAGDGITGGTSGATATIVAVGSTWMTLSSISGTFTRGGEAITGDGVGATTQSLVKDDIVMVYAVKYNSTQPLQRISAAALSELPTWMDEEYPEYYAPIGNVTIRLNFNPASLSSGLKFIYGYVAESSIVGDHSDFMIEGQYFTAIIKYVLARYLEPISGMEKLATQKLEEYLMEVKGTQAAMKNKYR